MSILQKKIIPSKEEHEKKILERYSRVYYSRLGKIRYLVLFPLFPSTNNGKQGLFITDREVNGIPYGTYGSIKKSEIRGTLMEISEVPEKILNLIRRELRHGKYL